MMIFLINYFILDMCMSIILSSFLLILTYLLLKIFQTYFLKNNILDNFNHRSSHKVIATRSGGVSIIASIFIISIFYYIFNQIYTIIH